MIEWLDTSPSVEVAPDEYRRLLGYPQGREPEGRAAELAAWARAWYTERGRPWIYTRQIRDLGIEAAGVGLDGDRFASARLARLFSDARAESAVLVAVSAGEELERTSAALWREEKPDEYFFLEIFGSAVVEHLVMVAGARLCAWGDGLPLAVLPHDSPGYPEWDIAEQPRLLARLRAGAGIQWPAAIEALESGALTPKKSLLAVFGLTSHVDRVRRLTTLVPCQSCALAGCQYRRLPYERDALAPADGGRAAPGRAPAVERAPLDLSARYRVNQRALRRWSDERLTLGVEADQAVTAIFRYDGTTCTNMGRPLAFLYEVRLGVRADGFPVKTLRCVPAPGDTGHQAMCRYVKEPESLMRSIDEEVPAVAGARLDEAIAWVPQASPAGCYCEAASREHKWGLVLETIHFALARRELAALQGTNT
jgi:hypothetical protein